MATNQPAVLTATVSNAVTPVAFALTPGGIDASKIINLSSKTMMLVYKKATPSLTISFDGNSNDINLL